MCLLVVVWRPGSASPLVVAANRDEKLDRPAVVMTVLQGDGPRILGGRDALAGGTWLAVNEHGVVAGLTNSPSPGGRDDTKRSRGALPLMAARHCNADAAVEDLVARVRPQDYNPAWMMVGDTRTLYAVTIAGGTPLVEALPPGIHVLENHAPGSDSVKVQHVLDLVGPTVIHETAVEALVEGLVGVLADHSLPPGDLDAILAADEAARAAAPGEPRSGEPDGAEAPKKRPVEVFAACVHADGYGTRSSAVVTVPAGHGERPHVLVADGPPCRSSFVDCSEMWLAPVGEGAANP